MTDFFYEITSEERYLETLEEILEKGTWGDDRTGTGTQSLFGIQMRFDLSQGFPLLTTKKMFWKGIVHELLWFIRGDTNIRSLQENGVKIWDAWANEDGDCGPIYGAQWRDFGGVDQISVLVDQLVNNPYSRRHIVSAWNPPDIDSMALPPCHMMFQCYVREGKLSLHMYQRSADMFLGVPFNIASYALLTHMLAHVCNLKVGEFVHTIGDAHIYKNHIQQCHEQLDNNQLPLPTIELNSDVKSIFDFRFEDIVLKNYKSHPAIKGAISV